MTRINDLPIYQKLLALIVLSSSVSLLVVGMVIVAYDAVTYTTQSISDLKTQAEIVGTSSTAALTFNDAAAARQNLEALDAKQSITAAAIYGAGGKIFVSYLRKGEVSEFPNTAGEGPEVIGGNVTYFYPIMQGGKRIGVVYLRAHLERGARILKYATIVLMVMVIGLLFGVLVSASLQKIISAPIHGVTKVAQGMIRHGDDPAHPYRERATKMGNDEIGVLTDAFNQLLNFIERRDEALVAANRSLSVEVAERERAQEMLKRKVRDLAMSNAELEQFAYVSSHDLQEPLRMVASYAQLLEKRYGEQFDADGLEFLHYVVDGAKRMRQLIDDLLSFARVGAHTQPLTEVDSGEALNLTLANLQPAIEESEAKISVDPLPVVMADQSQLVQLFQNLIANAIVYRRPVPLLIDISADRKDDQWEFTFRDNGIGIAPEHQERIFVIFQRLHGKEEFSGTGIGLAICKKIVERHGGRIWVESQIGQGSTFHFLLPAVP